MVRKLNLFIIAVVSIFLQTGHNYAQIELKPQIPSTKDESYQLQDKRKATYEQCMKDFNFNKIDFSSPFAKQNSTLLKEYLQCRSTLNDSAEICNKLTSVTDIEMCRGYFNDYIEFLGQAITKGFTKRGMDSCKKILGDKSKCEDFLRGLNKKDSSICDKVTGRESDECKAQIEGRPNLCPSLPCQYKAIFVEAVRQNNINMCSEIQDGLVNSICRAYISRKEQACEESKWFVIFKNKYCTEISK